MSKLTDKRIEYTHAELLETQVHDTPLAQFSQWYAQAEMAKLVEPYAFTLATCGSDMRPSARTLLLRDFNANGFYFYSHYDSHKGQQLAQNPHAEMLFFWPALERQVRIQGIVVPISPEDSQSYFAQRPLQSQIAATVSTPQSGVIASKTALINAFNHAQQQYSNQAVTCPTNWGGYCLTPTQVEFWQGGAHRLHDRLLYTQHPHNGWNISRLMP